MNVTEKIEGSWSGLISQRYGSMDPDPYQKVPDPEHWVKLSKYKNIRMSICTYEGKEENARLTSRQFMKRSTFSALQLDLVKNPANRQRPPKPQLCKIISISQLITLLVIGAHCTALQPGSVGSQFCWWSLHQHILKLWVRRNSLALHILAASKFFSQIFLYTRVFNKARIYFSPLNFFKKTVDGRIRIQYVQKITVPIQIHKKT